MKLNHKFVRTVTTTAAVLGAAAMLSVGAWPGARGLGRPGAPVAGAPPPGAPRPGCASSHHRAGHADPAERGREHAGGPD